MRLTQTRAEPRHNFTGVTMTLPDGITTCAVSVGPLSDFGGDPYVLKVEWQPVLDGKPNLGIPRSITWTATGQPLASFAERVESTSGGSVTLQLPHVDQAGFIDGNGDAFTMWEYRVYVTATSAALLPRKTYKKTKHIQVLVGQTTADFDMIADGTGGVPVTSPTPTVISVNGQTGVVVVAGGGGVQSVVAGTNVTVDETDPANPIVSATGAVDSVNGEVGAVALDADDIPDGTTAKQYTATEKAKLAAITGTNTGDQDLSGLVPITRTINGHALSANVTVTKGDVGLSDVDNTSDAAKPVSTAQGIINAAKADLVSGLVPTSQIPAIALTTGQVVANRAALLALTAQEGDIGVISGTSDKGSYILTTADPTVFANWLLLSSPTDVVTTVNGQTGTVVLGKADVGLGSVDNTADSAKPVSTPQAVADSAATAAAQASSAQRASNLSDLANAATARANLGLGTAATQAVGAFDAAGAATAAQAASQPVDSDLTAIAALTTTAYGRAILELANQAALMALVATASTTAEGKVELATDAEAVTGTDTSRALTVAAWRAGLRATSRDTKVMRTGRYYGPPPGSTTTTSIVNNTIAGITFIVPKAITVDRIGVEVTTAVAASTLRLAIYNTDPATDEPTTLLLDSITELDSSTTGVKEATISQVLAPGTYVLAVAVRGTGISVRGRNVFDQLMGQNTINTAANLGIGNWQATQASGALNAAYNTPTPTVGLPAIYVRIA